MFPIKTRPESFWTLEKKPPSSIWDSPGKKKIKQFPKYKRQALANIVIWNYVKQIPFLRKKKARFLEIKKKWNNTSESHNFKVSNAPMHKLVQNLVMSFVHWHSNFMRQAIVLWLSHKLFINWLFGLYTALFELYDKSLKFLLYNIDQVMNSKQLMKNENMKLEQVNKLNI